jgi:hypothetical protein
MSSEWTPWYRFKLADGRVVVGAVQGSGGVIGGRSVAEATDGVRRLRVAIKRAEEGERTGIYEPKPGHACLYPEYSFASQGPRISIPLVGATVMLAKNPRERLRAHEAAGGRSAKGRITHAEAKQVLEARGIKLEHDFDRDVRSLSDANLIAEMAKEAGYRKSKTAPGSTARMYFQYLHRIK